MNRDELKNHMPVVNTKNGRRAKVNWIGERTGLVAFRYDEGVGTNRFGHPRGTNVRTMDMKTFLIWFEAVKS